MPPIISVFFLNPKCELTLRDQALPGRCAPERDKKAQDNGGSRALRREEPARLKQGLLTASRFSPLFAPDSPPPDIGKGEAELYSGINMDVGGSESLFGGAAAILRALITELNNAGIACRASCAPSLGAAWALSRFGNQAIFLAERHEIRARLAPLPVEALRLSAGTGAALRDLNIRRIGELLRLPRPSLLARFGPILLERLDSALGVRDAPIAPFRFPAPLKTKKEFDSPLTQPEALAAVCENLLDELLSSLEGNQKIGRLLLQVKTAYAPLQCKTVSLSVPANDKKHLWRLLQSKVEQVDPGLGVEEAVLCAAHIEDELPAQCGAGADKDAAAEREKEFGVLLDVFLEELGEESVRGVQCFASHIPEKTFTYVPLPASRAAGTGGAGCPLTEAQRPSILFYKPEPIEAMAVMPDSAPFWLKWKNKTYRTAAAKGPERIAPEWWGTNDPLFGTRDYFVVQLQTGLWLWIFRELETSAWFVHGIWA